MMGSAAAAVVRKGLLYLHLSTVYVPEEFRRGVGITLPPFTLIHPDIGAVNALRIMIPIPLASVSQLLSLAGRIRDCWPHQYKYPGQPIKREPKGSPDTATHSSRPP